MERSNIDNQSIFSGLKVSIKNLLTTTAVAVISVPIRFFRRSQKELVLNVKPVSLLQAPMFLTISGPPFPAL